MIENESSLQTMSAFSVSTRHSSLFPFQFPDIPGVGAESTEHPITPVWGKMSLPQCPSSLLSSHLSLLASAGDRTLSPSSVPIHRHPLDSSVAARRSDGRAGGAWYQTRWYKTMETYEKLLFLSQKEK